MWDQLNDEHRPFIMSVFFVITIRLKKPIEIVVQGVPPQSWDSKTL